MRKIDFLKATRKKFGIHDKWLSSWEENHMILIWIFRQSGAELSAKNFTSIFYDEKWKFSIQLMKDRKSVFHGCSKRSILSKILKIKIQFCHSSIARANPRSEWRARAAKDCQTLSLHANQSLLMHQSEKDRKDRIFRNF